MIIATTAISLAALAGCSAAKTTATTAPPASVQATAGCPSAITPDANGVCQVGSITPASPKPVLPSSAKPLASVPGAELTASQQQAVDAAQQYLGDGQGFSYNGLVKQLTSQYGNGFPEADAKFAVNYLHPDWDAQAVQAAKGYMQLGGFSRQSLIAQLTSAYGSEFTYDQAVYAANKVGL